MSERASARGVRVGRLRQVVMGASEELNARILWARICMLGKSSRPGTCNTGILFLYTCKGGVDRLGGPVEGSAQTRPRRTIGLQPTDDGTHRNDRLKQGRLVAEGGEREGGRELKDRYKTRRA